MRTLNKRAMIAAALLMSASISLSASAAKLPGAPAPVETCNGGLRLATGPVDKGYDKLGKDLQKIGANICIVNSEGGLDNLDLLTTKKADMGIVPLDALKTMSNSDENVQNLQVVATLNSNFLHVATLRNGFRVAGEKKYGGLVEGDAKLIRITGVSQLRGVPVALVGSAQLMGRSLNKSLGLNFREVDVASDAQAVEMLKKGQVYAVMTVASWPHGFLDKLKQNDGVTLVPLDVPVNGPYITRALNYKGMGVYNVTTLGVQNLLVTRKFNGKRSADVAQVKNALAENLSELQDGDYAPAWNEIKSLDNKVDWNNKFTGK